MTTLPTGTVRDLGHRETVATYPYYAEAQAAVDALSEAKFDVSTIKIVGNGVRSAEYVTGRMTKGRAALAGLAAGAWWGLLLGLLFGLFVPGFGWFQLVLTAVLLGALFGAVTGFFGHLATGGRRDFTSVRTLEADSYDLTVSAEYAGEVTQLLARRA